MATAIKSIEGTGGTIIIKTDTRGVREVRGIRGVREVRKEIGVRGTRERRNNIFLRSIVAGKRTIQLTSGWIIR